MRARACVGARESPFRKGMAFEKESLVDRYFCVRESGTKIGDHFLQFSQVVASLKSEAGARRVVFGAR